LLSTSVVGAQLARDFESNRPFLMEDDLSGLLSVFRDPYALAQGLPFSLTLLTILLAHEMGHYLTCRYYGIDASPPYFLPFPSLIGTLGAFIRIRSAICSKRQLFDVGIAGPIAGFVFLLPALAIGIAYSKVIPGIATQGDIVFSNPLILRILEMAIFPGVPVADIYLHPLARAAWVGVLATALNLMPMGQLDGGHILYAFAGSYHRILTNLFILTLLPLAFFYSWSWLLWAALLFLFGRRHPRIYDPTPMTPARGRLGIIALVMFILCFSLAPVRT
jgi:membrane-associated protease RseP (regulator of RpoE activity)